MINTVEKYYFNNKFTSYKMTLDTSEIWSVPLDEANTDYQAIQKWIAEGGIVIDNAPSGTEAEGGEVIDNPPTE
jgi:hypothetical protein